MTITIPADQATRYGTGVCVAMIERNGYHDSDFLGVFAVATADGYRFVTERTGSTAYAGGFVPVEDATDDVLTAYRAARDDTMGRLAAERAERDAMAPAVGKNVTVVNPPTRGKNKMPVGSTGVVTRRVVNGFDSQWAIANDRRTYRVAVTMDDDNRTVWLDEARVRVTGYADRDLPVNMDRVDAVLAAAWPAR